MSLTWREIRPPPPPVCPPFGGGGSGSLGGGGAMLGCGVRALGHYRPSFYEVEALRPFIRCASTSGARCVVQRRLTRVSPVRHRDHIVPHQPLVRDDWCAQGSANAGRPPRRHFLAHGPRHVRTPLCARGIITVQRGASPSPGAPHEPFLAHISVECSDAGLGFIVPGPVAGLTTTEVPPRASLDPRNRRSAAICPFAPSIARVSRCFFCTWRFPAQFNAANGPKFCSTSGFLGGCCSPHKQ